MSDYVRSIRDRIGHDLLMLPGVSAVIRDGERILLARGVGSHVWSLIGGGIEPSEEPVDAVAREVLEETGARVRVGRIIGSYGGAMLTTSYANGDRVSYVTTAYECVLLDDVVADGEEIAELRWFDRAEIAGLMRAPFVDRVLADAWPDTDSAR